MLALISIGVVLLGITLPYIWILLGGEPLASTVELSNLMIVIFALVAIFAGGAYSVLSRQLQAENQQETQQTIKKAEGKIEGKMVGKHAWLFLVAGKTFWDVYERSGRQNKDYLELAISLTNIAYEGETEEKLRKMAEEDPEIQVMYCDILNDLAYYYAERGKSEDRIKALAFCEHIKDKIKEFPLAGADWQDTYEFVKQKYNKT